MSKKVLVWRDSWLPYSQTFVADHVQSLSSYAPLTAGLVVTDEVQRKKIDFRCFSGYKLRRLEKMRFAFGGFKRLVRYIDKHPVDLVHAHFGPGGIRLSRVCRRQRIPLVVTFHGFDVMDMPNRGLRGKLYRRQLKKLFRSSALLLPVSDFLRAELIKLGAPEHKTFTHYLGTSVTPPVQSNGFRDREGILFVGRLTPNKGAAELFRAVSSDRFLSGITVTVVGDGEQMPHLMTLAENLGIKVRFTGALAHHEVIELMDSHRVFCLPSYRVDGVGPEAFGMVFAEAAMRGLPSCGFSQGGVSEVVSHGQSGLLADAGDFKQLADHILRIYSDESVWATFADRSLKISRDKFSLAVQSERLEELYDAVIQQKKS